MTSVLVTGASGFIGSWVTRKLTEQGVRVVAYSRHPDASLLKDVADRVDFVAGDVLDLPSLIKTIKDYHVERVVHLSTALIKPLEANPFLGYRTNVDGTLNVYEASRLMGVKRVVYISSRAAYATAKGEYGPPGYKPIDEDYPRQPRTVYGATKVFMEDMGLSYNRIYGLDFIGLRFSVTYGPGKQARHAVSDPTRIVEGAMFAKPIKLSGDIDQPDDMIYVKDIASGVALACFAGNLQHRIFHLGTGKRETLRHMIEIVTKMFGKVQVEVSPKSTAASSPIAHYVFNIERARTELGYAPQYDMETGIKDYVQTIRQLGSESSVLS